MSAIDPGTFSRLVPGSLWRSTNNRHAGYVYRVRELRSHHVVVEGVAPRHAIRSGGRWSVGFVKFLREHVPAGRLAA